MATRVARMQPVLSLSKGGVIRGGLDGVGRRGILSEFRPSRQMPSPFRRIESLEPWPYAGYIVGFTRYSLVPKLLFWTG